MSKQTVLKQQNLFCIVHIHLSGCHFTQMADWLPYLKFPHVCNARFSCNDFAVIIFAADENNEQWKKRSERRKHCALVVVTRSQKFSPGGADSQNLISWRWSLPLPTNAVWRGSMHAISSYRDNRPTNKQTQLQTHKQTGPITIHCAAMLSAQCNRILFKWINFGKGLPLWNKITFI